MKRPAPKVVVRAIQIRKDGRARPFSVSWRVGNLPPFHDSFATKDEAEDLVRRIKIASRDGVRFSSHTGLPAEWGNGEVVVVATWARDWIQGEWNELAPRTRQSYVESLARLIEVAVAPRSRELKPAERQELATWLRVPGHKLSVGLDSWISRNSFGLDDLGRGELALIDRALRTKLDGTPMAPNTASRHVRTARTCLGDAVERGIIDNLVWPTQKKGAKRKSARKAQPVEISVIEAMSPDSFAKLLAAIPSHQPASRMYQAMTAVIGYAGLRPEEILALVISDLHLPETGWGSIKVMKAYTGAGIDWGTKDENIGLVKSSASNRLVPISPKLVRILREYLDSVPASSGEIFRTATGGLPQSTNWNRSLTRAAERAGVPRVAVYDLRHMAASHMCRSGLPLAQAAKRLGHTSEVLVRFYLEPVEGDDERCNQLLDGFYES